MSCNCYTPSSTINSDAMHPHCVSFKEALPGAGNRLIAAPVRQENFARHHRSFFSTLA